jgi:hypothetical protein
MSARLLIFGKLQAECFCRQILNALFRLIPRGKIQFSRTKDRMPVLRLFVWQWSEIKPTLPIGQISCAC